MLANCGDPDHMQNFAASDQGRHCLSMSYKKDARIAPRLCLLSCRCPFMLLIHIQKTNKLKAG